MYDVGDAARDKAPARIKARHHMGRHPAVETAEPEEFRRLMRCEAGDMARFLRLPASRSGTIAG